jgi:hypothetical protein
MTATYTINLPISACAICGKRDWRHVSVLGASGAYCMACSYKALRDVGDLRARHQRDFFQSGVFTMPPMWKPPLQETKE